MATFPVKNLVDALPKTWLSFDTLVGEEVLYKIANLTRPVRGAHIIRVHDSPKVTILARCR